MKHFITNFNEAHEEARRLSKVLKRGIDANAINCPCDYSKACYVCAGSGTYYELVYSFCQHSVGDGDGLECDANDCARKEREAAMVERVETWPRVSAPLRSCSDLAIEQAETEAA